MNTIKYYLALERRLGDHALIDINKLDITSSQVSSDLASIDLFTSKYSEDEIRESIKRSNMASNYIDGNLKIISDARHNLRVLTKNEFNTIMDIQNSNEPFDRDFKNKIFGAYKKSVEHTFQDKIFIRGMLDAFKDILNSDDKIRIFKVISEIPYANVRTIYFNIYDEYVKRLEINKRKLEKTNDNN